MIAFRLALGIRHGPPRAVAAALALATIPLGTEGSALLQLGALVALLAACLAVEARSVEAAQPLRSP